MKELSIEEKAKAYDEAIERAESIYNEIAIPSATTKGICTYIFPELKENEDEKIRKELIGYLEQQPGCKILPNTRSTTFGKVIAWLEKQGDYNRLVEEIKRCKELISKEREKATSVNDKLSLGGRIAMLEELLAFNICTKDGDVLAVTMYPEGTWIGIFKEQNGCTFSSHCFVNTEGTFKLGTYNHGNGKAIHPATKEQRDTLFAKMKEAGYEWDAAKKELKKIKHNLVWSEYDENIICFLINVTENYRIRNGFSSVLEQCDKAIDWLKSLKDRYTWKPSDEQMKALEFMVRSYGESGYASPYENNTKLLYSLLNDLKKLKKE